MNELLSPSLGALGRAALGGAALGVLFYGGLYWTILRGIGSATPALWFSGSLLLRTALVLVGLYAISGGDWHRLVACFPGFMLARVIVTRWGYRSGVMESSRPAGAP
jgi:F1F0 ATPase subunit 2